MTTPGNGFYKYHCRYFNSDRHCPEWVWVNNGTCPTCLADGLDDELSPAAAWAASRDVMVPHVYDGILQYAHMDITVSEQGEESLIMRNKTFRRPPPPAIPVTTMMPKEGALVASTF